MSTNEFGIDPVPRVKRRTRHYSKSYRERRIFVNPVASTDRNCIRRLDISDIVDSLQVMPKVPILLWAHVRLGAHRLAAHRASGATGGDNRR